MPAFISGLLLAIGGFLRRYAVWFIAGLSSYVPQFIGKALATLGVSYGAYHFGVTPLLSTIQQSLNGVPAFALQAFSAMGGDQAITIILSAVGISAGSRVVFRKTS